MCLMGVQVAVYVEWLYLRRDDSVNVCVGMAEMSHISLGCSHDPFGCCRAHVEEYHVARGVVSVEKISACCRGESLYCLFVAEYVVAESGAGKQQFVEVVEYRFGW